MRDHRRRIGSGRIAANSGEHGMRDSMYESSADRLQGVIGACRTLH